MAPTSERTAPTKKSLRIWVRNNGHVMRKKTRVTYVYPRTVEAAKDPFECTSGKNKMFYLIAINLFPESKIIRPDDSDSETEVEETSPNDGECTVEEEEMDSNSKLDSLPPTDIKQKRTRRSPTVERTTQSPPEPVKPSKCTSETNGSPHPQSQQELAPSHRKSASSSIIKPPLVRARLLPLKKTALKITKCTENFKECSKVSGCENCLSSSESVPVIPRNKIRVNEGVAKATGTVLNARKLPPIPTIMSSLNKIIESCSASGVVSFSLAKKKPRQSRS